MALRREDLQTAPDADVIDFPVRIARARARRARQSLVTRRLVALGLTLVLVAGLASLSAAGQGSEVSSKSGAPSSVVVQPGDTLWEVAQQYAAPGSDPRAYVDELISLNDVSGVAPPGTALDLP